MGTKRRITSLLLFIQADVSLDPDDEAVAMDCNDLCEQLAEVAERVARGERLADLLPAYAEHLTLLTCCQQEFDALVAVLRAEIDAQFDSGPPRALPPSHPKPPTPSESTPS